MEIFSKNVQELPSPPSPLVPSNQALVTPPSNAYDEERLLRAMVQGDQDDERIRALEEDVEKWKNMYFDYVEKNEETVPSMYVTLTDT